jgi:hypothetical protein
MSDRAGMTLDEARDVVRHTSVDERPTGTYDDHAWDRAFDEAPASVQEPFRDAMVVFLADGTAQEQQMARSVLSAHRFGPGHATRLAALYVERGWDTHHPAAELMHFVQYQIAEHERAALRRIFVADPLKHSLLAEVALMDGTSGPAWAAFTSLVRATNDAGALHRLFSKVAFTSALKPFYALIAEKPEPVIRALAATSYDHGREMLAACLAPTGPKLDRVALAKRLTAGRDCLVEPTFGKVERGDRYALYVDGPDVKVVHHDPTQDRVRSLKRHPRKELGAVLAEVTGAVVPEARLAALDRRTDPLFAAVGARERREAEIRQGLRDGSHWLLIGHPAPRPQDVQRGGYDTTECFLRRGAIGWYLADYESGDPVYGRILGDGYLARILDDSIYERSSRDPSLVPADQLRRWEAAEALVAATLRRLHAGEVAVRWGGAREIGPGWARPDAPQVVTGQGGALWEVEVTHGRPRGVKALGEQWEWNLRNCLLGLAVRGTLVDRLVELAPGTSRALD